MLADDILNRLPLSQFFNSMHRLIIFKKQSRFFKGKTEYAVGEENLVIGQIIYRNNISYS